MEKKKRAIKQCYEYYTYQRWHMIYTRDREIQKDVYDYVRGAQEAYAVTLTVLGYNKSMIESINSRLKMKAYNDIFYSEEK